MENNKEKYSLHIKNNSNKFQKVSITDYLKSNPMQPEIEIVQTHGDKEILTKEFNHIALMRCLFDAESDFLFDSFHINGNSHNYLDAFSVYAFNGNALDIHLDYTVTNDSTFEVEIPANSSCIFSFYSNGVNTGDINILGRVSPKGLWYTIENNSDEARNINLMDESVFDSSLKPDFNLIKHLRTKNSSSNELLKPHIKNALVRIHTRNRHALVPIINHNGVIIPSQQYLSAMQFQSTAIDCHLGTEIKYGDKFEFTVPPKTKMLVSITESDLAIAPPFLNAFELQPIK